LYKAHLIFIESHDSQAKQHENSKRERKDVKKISKTTLKCIKKKKNIYMKIQV